MIAARICIGSPTRITTEKCLLIVAHAPSPNTPRLRDALAEGARHGDVRGVAVKSMSPFEAGAADVLSAQAIILGTTENLGTMSGALKDFFDRIYYPCLEKTQGLPYALFIRAGHDGTGTRRAVASLSRFRNTASCSLGPARCQLSIVCVRSSPMSRRPSHRSATEKIAPPRISRRCIRSARPGHELPKAMDTLTAMPWKPTIGVWRDGSKAPVSWPVTEVRIIAPRQRRHRTGAFPLLNGEAADT